MFFTITNSQSDSIPAGLHNDAKFEGVEKFTSKGEDTLLRWKWTLPDGRKASAVTGCEKATVKNRLGKFLCMLANKPLSEITVNTEEHIGKMYSLFVETNEKGSQVQNFSLKS
jgi:hypothetical protein